MTEQMVNFMCQTNNLKEVTTDIQRKNGTRSFADMATVNYNGNTDVYMIYTKSGYVRRSRYNVNTTHIDHYRKEVLNPRADMFSIRKLIYRGYRDFDYLWEETTTYADIRDTISDSSVLRSMLTYMNYCVFVRRINSGKFSHMLNR